MYNGCSDIGIMFIFFPIYAKWNIAIIFSDIFGDNAVFTLCIGCAFIFGLIITGIIFYKRHTNRTSAFIISHDHNETIQHPTANRTECIYEEIDDITLPDPDQHQYINNCITELSSNDSTSSDRKSISNPEEQYLNPYQIIVQNIEDRPYNFIGRSGTEIINDTDTTTSLGVERYEEEADKQKEQHFRKKTLKNKVHSLNYPEITFINRTDTDIKINVEKCKNNQISSNRCPQDNTEYVEIVHNE